MCLTGRLPKKQKEKIMQEARKRGYFRVYKVVQETNTKGKQTGTNFGLPYQKGFRATYRPGWYVFLKRGSAQWWKAGMPHRKIVTCYAKLSWLQRLAHQENHSVQAATFHTLVFPDWDKGDMTIREFRAACKVKK